MAKYSTEYINLEENISQIWVTEDEDSTTRRLAYEINKERREILFFPKPGEFFIDEVLIEGFDSLPTDFSDKGYIKMAQYNLKKKLEDNSVTSFTISKYRDSKFRKVRNKNEYALVLNYEDFKEIRNQFLQVKDRASNEKKDIIDGFFYNHFPQKFEPSSVASSRRYRNVIRNLVPEIIPHFSSSDLIELEAFIGKLLEERYESESYKFKQLTRTKIKVDTIAIDRILDEFKTNVENEISENEWGKYLRKNLFLLDSKYIKIIPELNVILSGSRNADFGMIDTKGYLDIFEIKKPSTLLLSSSMDRGNYYWHTSAVKAIVQAEKYLFNAERKASNLAEDIEREQRISVKVVKPRAFLIMGHSDQLDETQKVDDFKVLRQSLKNIDIVLYDELLEGLENQKNKYYDQITAS